MQNPGGAIVRGVVFLIGMSAIHSFDRVFFVESWVSGWVVLGLFLGFIIWDLAESLGKGM